MPFVLRSAAFNAEARIPARFTCDGDDMSPPLAWSGAPAGTGSFALFCDDPDAPSGTWHHWALYDIPAETTSLAENQPPVARIGAGRQAINDFKRTGYGGPCPPKGHGAHHYRFLLIALGTEHLDLPERAQCREARAAADRHRLAAAELIGTYSR